MIKMYFGLIKAICKSKKGQGMVEYGLIIGLIAVVIIGVVTTLGTQIKALFQSLVTALGGGV